MIEAIVGVLGTAFLGVVGWAVQLAHRVTVLETRQVDLLELINSKFDGIYQRLERIERAMNGHLKDVD